jgi:hypothetical protein
MGQAAIIYRGDAPHHFFYHTSAFFNLWLANYRRGVWLVWESGYDWALSPCMWPKAVAVGGLNAWSRRRRRRRGRRWTPQGSQRVVQLFRVSTGYIGIRLMGASPPPPSIHTDSLLSVCLSVCLLSVCLSDGFPVPNLHDFYCWKFQYVKAIWKNRCELVSSIWLKTFLLCEVVFDFNTFMTLQYISVAILSTFLFSPVTFWDFDSFRWQVSRILQFFMCIL